MHANSCKMMNICSKKMRDEHIFISDKSQKERKQCSNSRENMALTVREFWWSEKINENEKRQKKGHKKEECVTMQCSECAVMCGHRVLMCPNKKRNVKMKTKMFFVPNVVCNLSLSRKRSHWTQQQIEMEIYSDGLMHVQ